MRMLIDTSELRPGMYVIDPGLDWIQNPYLYMADELLESEEAIRCILDEGYKEVYIDPSRSTVLPTAPLPVESPLLSEEHKFFHKPKIPLQEELHAAAEIHDEGVAYTRNFMKEMRAGKLNMKPAASLMEHILDSLDRNADALITLSRLRRTDSYTYMHCMNVCVLMGLFSRHLGHTKQQVFACGLAGLFHDLGKSMIALPILHAARKLTRAEWNVMRSHPILGHEQLAAVPGVLPEVLLGVLHHHEKIDGSGYPAGLSHNAISEVGGMVGVADIYDALTSKRSYKEAMHPHKALGIMYEMRGKDLREDLLAHFIRMLGVYPMGSVVELSDGAMGVVSAITRQPARPEVTIVRDKRNNPIPPIPRDLSSDTNKLTIMRCLAPEAAGINPAEVLGTGI